MWRHLGVGVLAVLVLSVPIVAFAQAGEGFFGPIVAQPDNECFCPGSAPDWGCVMQTVQNVINVAVSLAAVISVLWISYAGFLLVTSGSNVSRRQMAKEQILKAAVGFVVLLSAWIIVDFAMKTLYNPDETFAGGRLGPWVDIWAPKADGSDRCILVRDPVPITEGFLGIVTGGTLGGGGGATTGNVTFNTVGACSPTSLQNAASQTGIRLTSGQAAFLACVARPESTCGTRLQNYNWGKGSSAYGPFQILLDGNARYYENQACYKAAGVSGPLNCAAGFRGGNPIPGSPIPQLCMKASANLACSTAAAYALIQANRSNPTGPWTGNRDSTAKHQQCKALYN